MTIGGGIFLLVVGAILAFAVDDTLGGVDLAVVGWICMGAGALAIILSLVLMQRSTARATVVERPLVERRDPPVL